MAAAAGSLYGALLGLGVCLVGAPPPLGGSRPLFVAACPLLAAALVPVRLRELGSDESDGPSAGGHA